MITTWIVLLKFQSAMTIVVLVIVSIMLLIIRKRQQLVELQARPVNVMIENQM